MSAFPWSTLITAAGTLAEPSVYIQDVIDKGTGQVDRLNEAVAMVQICGSASARDKAQVLYERFRTAAAHYAAAGTVMAEAGRAGTPLEEMPAFDASAAARDTDRLESAISEFVDAVRPDSPSASSAQSS